ncbi:MAG: hypothetical protein GKS06_08675 [Acidobacteria bacterium]|nr:hypothetical protein [Acidobacteriota bacterium]
MSRRRVAGRGAVLVATMAIATGCGPSEAPISDVVDLIPTLTRIATLGCGDCDGPDALAVVSVEVYQERVVVRDKYEPLVRIFDLGGGAPQTFGVLGEGPGEFGPIELPIFATSDARLFAYELEAMHEYSSAGEHLAAFDWPMRLPIGHYFDTAGRLAVISAPPPYARRDRRDVEVIEYRPGADDFGPHVLVPADALPYADDSGDRTLVSTIGISPAGDIVLGDPIDYVIFWYDREGALLDRVVLERQPPSVPPMEQRRYEEWRRNLAVTDELKSRNPHFVNSGFHFDDAGRLWVQTLRWSGAGDERTTTTFDVFDEQHEFVGSVEVPVALTGNWPTTTIRRDLLAGSYIDADGHHRVAVWRIID